MGGDIKGGGMTFYESIKEQNPSLIYGEGLRVPLTTFANDLDGVLGTATFGKKKSFERVNKIKNFTFIFIFRVLLFMLDLMQLNI